MLSEEEKKIKHCFKKNIYLSLKDIATGIVIGSFQEPVYGTAGRTTMIEIHIIFLHIKLGIIRSGFKCQKKKRKQ